MTKITIIGCGNAGSQVAALASKKYGNLVNAIAINSSTGDLQLICKDCDCIKIGSDGIDGSGMDRTKAREYLRVSIMDVLNDPKLVSACTNSEYVFIVSSTGGGTGSSIAPMLYTGMYDKYDAKFILVSILPGKDASTPNIGNTLMYLDELYNKLPKTTTYMSYDNSKSSQLGTNAVCAEINDAIVEDIGFFTRRDFYPAEYNNIDTADMLRLVDVPGRLVISKITTGLSINNIDEDNTLDKVITQSIRHTMHSDIDKDKIIMNLGIVSYLDAPVLSQLDMSLPKFKSTYGTPITVFANNACAMDSAGNCIVVVMSGLSLMQAKIDAIQSTHSWIESATISDSKSVNIDIDRISRINKQRSVDVDNDIHVTDVDNLFDSFGF